MLFQVSTMIVCKAVRKEMHSRESGKFCAYEETVTGFWCFSVRASCRTRVLLTVP